MPLPVTGRPGHLQRAFPTGRSPLRPISPKRPQLTFTVSGTFTSLTTVHGTITGNYGCGTDSFSISVHPRPVISTDPCNLLTKVHAVRTIGEGQPASNDIGEDKFDTSGGECFLEIGRGPAWPTSVTSSS